MVKVKTYVLSKKRLLNFIKDNKFLNDPKYYKNNIWSLAHFESNAANGTAGSCWVCRSGYYNASLENKRRPIEDSSLTWKCNEIFKACDRCKDAIEEKIGYRFLTR